MAFLGVTSWKLRVYGRVGVRREPESVLKRLKEANTRLSRLTPACSPRIP